MLPLESIEVAEWFWRNRKRAEYRMTFANRWVDQRDAMRLRRGGSIGLRRKARTDRQSMHVMK
jgi:hypothetical protein